MQKELSTRASHLGHRRKLSSQLINIPPYRGSTVTYENMEEFKNRKTLRGKRWGMTYGLAGNPATYALEEALCDIEGAEYAFLTNSGLSAVTTPLLAFLSAGDHLLMVDSVYDPSRSFCDGLLARMGVEIEYYPPRIGGEIEKLIKPNTRVIFLESPGSLTFEIQDTPNIVKAAKKHNVITMIDNTWSAGVYHKPLDLGVDISIQAATKYQCGHSDVLIGAILTNEQQEPMLNAVSLLGQGTNGDDAYLTLRGLRTMPLRLDEVNEKSVELATWLEGLDAIKAVYHPALASHPDHALWKRDFTGSSGLFAIQLATTDEVSVAQFIDSLELFYIGASWGGYESLIIPCVTPRNHETIDQDKGALLRLQIGLESLKDLKNDLSRAISVVNLTKHSA